MAILTERLKIRLESVKLRRPKKEAKERWISMAQVVREATGFLFKEDRQARRRAVEKLLNVAAPVADWDQMEL